MTTRQPLESRETRGGVPRRKGLARQIAENVYELPATLTGGAINLQLPDSVARMLAEPLATLGYALKPERVEFGGKVWLLTKASSSEETYYFLHFPAETEAASFDRQRDVGLFLPRGSNARVLSQGLDAPPLEWEFPLALWREKNELSIHFVGWDRIDSLEQGEEIVSLAEAYLQLKRLEPVLLPDAERKRARRRKDKGRGGVFVSYSHDDPDRLKEFETYVGIPLANAGYRIWNDGEIPAGAGWLEEIKKELKRARVIVFLVSQPFLNSRFIQENELGPALAEIESLEVTVFCIAVGYMSYEDWPIKDRQWAYGPPDPDRGIKPINQLEKPEMEREMVEVKRKLQRILEGDELP